MGSLRQWIKFRETRYGAIALALLVAVNVPAEVCASDAPESVAAQTPELPPRLAPLGLEKLMDLEVSTVYRTESTIGASAAAVSVMTAEDIRRSGATTIPELLRRVPGVNVARIDNGKWAISVRGFNDVFSNKLLVQVDGRTVYNPMFSGVYWDTVDYPLEDIERIEVIRGPGASVWGANAVNGVINIITKSSTETEGGLLDVVGGSKERAAGTIRFGASAGDKLSYRVYGKGFDRDEQFSSAGSSNDRWSGASAGTRFDWQPGERDSVSFDAGYLHSSAGRTAQTPTTTPPFSATLSDTEITDTGHLLGSWTHTLRDDSSWTLMLYWDDFRRYADALKFDLVWQTYDVDFQHQFSVGSRHKIVWGAAYQVQKVFLGESGVDNGFMINWDQSRINPQLFSLFVQDQISLLKERLSLTLGSKFEHNDFTGFEVQPTARLLWTPNERQSGWLAVSRAVRTPSLNELELRGTFVPVTVSGVTVFPSALPNHHFGSEQVIAFEAGYRAQPAESFSLDGALFYNLYRNLASLGSAGLAPGPAPGTVTAVFTRGNEGHGESHGVELALDWKPSTRWRLYGTYTLLEMFLHPAGSEEGQSPEQQVYLQSSFNLPRDVELDLIGRWVDQLSGFNPSGSPGVTDRIPSYFALDLRLAWHPRRNLELSIVGQNLLDSHHAEFGTNPVFRGRVVELERSAYAKATWRF